jgi:tetratricopeptide (TPR) repeat protein
VRAFVLVLCLVPVLALAQTEEDAAGPDPYVVDLQDALDALMEGDRPGALAVLGTLTAEAPTRPEGHYVLGVAYRLGGEVEAALASFQTAADVAGDAPRWAARALSGRARLLEEDPARADEAIVAWEAFVAFAEAHRAVADPAVGQARLSALRARAERAAADASVRERIEARARDDAEAEPSEPER